MANPVNAQLDTLYRQQAGYVRATLIRLLGSFELAEEAVADAFAAAATQWPEQGMPNNPAAWLISAGRFRAIDRLRRRARFDASLDAIAFAAESEVPPPEIAEPLSDDQLRLIFVCCHPILPVEAQLALALREICGLTTEEIARAFLTRTPAMAQRIVRAKAKIREASIPYEVPDRAEWPARMDGVLNALYLMFNEAHWASSGDTHTRPDLAAEAIRLGRLLVRLVPDGEARGLLALMLLGEARRPAREAADGSVIRLAEQDRTNWNADLIAEGLTLTAAALSRADAGRFALEAGISAVHSRARSFEETDWDAIVALYDRLLIPRPSPIVALNRAIALSERDGPGPGLAEIDAVLEDGALADYPFSHAARGHLLERLGRFDEAIPAFERAVSLTAQGPERAALAARIEALKARPVA